MSDLISREQAIELYCQSMCGTDFCGGCDATHIIEHLPTAYDIDKVVERLTEERRKALEAVAKNTSHKERLEMMIRHNAIVDCIGIVKGGWQE